MPHSPGEHQQSRTTGSCNAGESSGEAAKEKKARAIADVWAAIAETKRNREQEGGQTKEAEPKATERRQDDGTEMTIADVQAATAAQKRKREVDIAETQEAEQRAKQRKDGTDKA